MQFKPILLGYTWVGILNQLVLQWFFVRLQVTVVGKDDPTVGSVKLIGFILPLTGWWSNYVWVWKVMHP